MKCPKCGFTSFDFLENCKKCGVDLQAHKSKFGLRSLIYPGFQAAEASPTLLDAVGDELADQGAAGEATDFGFDFMSEEDPPLETDEEPGLDVFNEEPADADDDVWGLDEDSPPLTESLDEELTDELADPESEFSFDNWEDEEPEDEKPPAGKEGPSDPFEVRESAVGEQAPEHLHLTDPADLPGAGPEQLSGPGGPFSEPTGGPGRPDPAPSVELATADGPEPRDDLKLFAGTEAQLADEADLIFADEPEPLDSPELFTSTVAELKNDSEPGLADEPELLDDLVLIASTEAELEDGAAEEPNPPIADIPSDLEEVVPIPPPSARILACLTDLLLLAAIFGIFLVVGEMTVPDPHGQRLLPSPATLVELAVPYFLVLFALCFGYFTLFHFLTGQTPGKMLFRLRVESITGEALLFSQAFLRSTGGLISLLCAGLGYLVAAFHRQGRGWNDQLAGSRLVALLGEEIDAEDLAATES